MRRNAPTKSRKRESETESDPENRKQFAYEEIAVQGHSVYESEFSHHPCRGHTAVPAAKAAMRVRGQCDWKTVQNQAMPVARA